MNPINLPLLPPELDYSSFLEQLTAAHSALTRLDTLLIQTPNPRIFERSFMTKEAVLSSRIEGTVASIGEVMDFDAGADGFTEMIYDDAIEITNYRAALERGIKLLDEKPISENTLKEIHRILLKSGRGANRSPGEFRKSQVFIAKAGQTIENATYIPPEAQHIMGLIQNLLRYIHEHVEKDDLVRIAISHYQFEAIHPFMDGNGRVGRLLISLMLHERKILRYPYLYLSEYFEDNRSSYYEGLRNVSYENKWNEWVRFFLVGFSVQATRASETVLKVASLYASLQPKMVKISPEYGLDLLEALFQRPVFSVGMLRVQMKLTNIQTSYSLVGRLHDLGIVRDLTPHKQRGKRYQFIELLSIIQGA